MREVKPAQSVHRRVMWVVALAVTMLGATSGPAMAATLFDKGSLMFNSSTPQTLTLSSDDGAAVNGPVTLLTGSGVAGTVPFTATGSCAGATKAPPVTKPIPCTLSVTYTGAAGATAGAQLSVSTTSGSKAVLLRANSPKATVCPTQGSTDCKASATIPTAFTAAVGAPTQQVFDIKAGPDGTAPLTVSGVTAAAPYTVDASSCSGIAPGGRCSAIVTFNPTAAGTYPATLTINSNDQISPGPSVSITGTATAAGAIPTPTIPGTIPGTLPGTSPGTTPGTATKRAGVTGFRFSARSVAPGGKGTFRFTLERPGPRHHLDRSQGAWQAGQVPPRREHHRRVGEDRREQHEVQRQDQGQGAQGRHLPSHDLDDEQGRCGREALRDIHRQEEEALAALAGSGPDQRRRTQVRPAPPFGGAESLNEVQGAGDPGRRATAGGIRQRAVGRGCVRIDHGGVATLGDDAERHHEDTHGKPGNHRAYEKNHHGHSSRARRPACRPSQAGRRMFEPARQATAAGGP